MSDIINLEMNNGLCDTCVYCIIHKLRECEWDMFEPVDIDKSRLYQAVDFDCVRYEDR